MNILILISTSFPPEEGIGHYTYHLSKKIIEKGHRVTIITRGSQKKDEFIYEGINVVKLPFLPIYPFHIIFHQYFVNQYLKDHESEFDLINIHMPLTPVPQTQLPIVSTIHGSLIGNAGQIKVIDLKSVGNKLLTKYLSQKLLKRLIERSNAVTTVSKPVKEELIEYYHANNIKVIFNGVDENKFFPDHDAPKENYILYVGRLSYGKGLFNLIDAADKLKNINIKFYLVGDGELKNRINKLIVKKSLQDKVFIRGQMNHDKLVEIYQKALGLIFPSHYEGFPTVVLEAMACELPIVLSNISAHKSILNDNEALFFQKGDVDNLALKIKLLIDDLQLRDKLGHNCREKVIQRYTWEKISSQYVSLFEEIAERDDS